MTLSPTLARALETLGRRQGATLFMTLMAAWSALLHRYTGQEDVAVGTPIANRTRVETETLLGFFVNTLVFRADVSGEPTFEDLLERVRETAIAAHAHQDVPFEKLVEVLQPERDLSRTPMFQVMFAVHASPLAPPTFGGLQIAPLRAAEGTAKFDLTVDVWERGEGLVVAFDYNLDLFEPATVARMAEHFRRLLEAIVLHPTERVARLEFLSAEERNELLVTWNDTRREYPRGLRLSDLVEAQVRARPQAPGARRRDDRARGSRGRRRRARRARSQRCPRDEPRVRPLHLGVHRDAERRDDRASLDLQSAPMAAGPIPPGAQ
jgi:non-ribosomal peptide synthetase component F